MLPTTPEEFDLIDKKLIALGTRSNQDRNAEKYSYFKETIERGKSGKSPVNNPVFAERVRGLVDHLKRIEDIYVHPSRILEAISKSKLNDKDISVKTKQVHQFGLSSTAIRNFRNGKCGIYANGILQLTFGLSPNRAVDLLLAYEGIDPKFSVEDHAEIPDFEPVTGPLLPQPHSPQRQRASQGRFRDMVLNAYGKCAITGVTTRAALEAAHIQDYMDERSQNVQNGIALRSDLHRLWDADLLDITETLQVSIHESISDMFYKRLHGRTLRVPDDPRMKPSIKALLWRKTDRQTWKEYRSAMNEQAEEIESVTESTA